MKRFYLYKITNTITDKIYIGMTSKPKDRFKQHLSQRSSCTKLRNSILKHGKENFKFEILCVGSEDYILDLEVKAINLFDSINKGYNLTLGNPRSGGASLSYETRLMISESLNRYYSENPGRNLGGNVPFRSDDTPCYVMGFWFPNRRLALKSLNINQKTYYARKLEGTLGDTLKISSDSVIYVPQYVGGFWFDNLQTASEKLNVSVASLKMRITRNSLEAETKRSVNRLKENNPMFGRTGKNHPRSRAIKIFGTIYDSISDAVRQTNLTKSVIEKSLKKNKEGFEYVDPS